MIDETETWSVRLWPALRAALPGERCSDCGQVRPYAWNEVHIRSALPDGWFRETRIVKHLCDECGRRLSTTLAQR